MVFHLSSRGSAVISWSFDTTAPGRAASEARIAIAAGASVCVTPSMSTA